MAVDPSSSDSEDDSTPSSSSARSAKKIIEEAVLARKIESFSALWDWLKPLWVPPPTPKLRAYLNTYHIGVAEFTPEEAEQAVSMVPPWDRNPSERAVEKYAEEFHRGQWREASWEEGGPPGQALLFASPHEGFAVPSDRPDEIDGQQRLCGGIQAGATVRYWVHALGIPSHQYDVTDKGRRRTLGDTMKRHGEARVDQMAAVVRLGLAYDRSETIPLPYDATYDLTEGECLGWLRDNPGIRDVLQWSDTAKNRFPRFNPAGLMYIFGRDTDPELNTLFWEAVIHGRGEGVTTLTHALRERLLRLPTHRVVNEKFMIHTMVWIKFVRWCVGDQATRVQLPKVGHTYEKWPWTSEAERQAFVKGARELYGLDDDEV